MHKRPQDQSAVEWLAEYEQDCSNVTPITTPEDDSGEGEVEGPSLLPEGEYRTRYANHSLIADFYGYGDKLVIDLTILDEDFQGEVVRGYYNVKITKTGFSSRAGSRWVQEMHKLLPHKTRRDRLPPSLLKGRTILAKIRTVFTGNRNRKLEDHQQYSVVEKLVRFVD